MKTLGERIRYARERAGLTVQQLAQAVSLTVQSVYQWEADETVPRMNRITQIAQALGVDAVWLQHGRGRPTGRAAPDVAPVGLALQHGHRVIPVVTTEAIQPDGTISIASSARMVATHYAASERAFGLEIQNRANAPRLEPGDLVVLDPDAHPRPGDIVLARLSGGEADLRRYRELPDGLVELAALNADWSPESLPRENLILLGVMTEHTQPRRT